MPLSEEIIIGGTSLNARVGCGVGPRGRSKISPGNKSVFAASSPSVNSPSQKPMALPGPLFIIKVSVLFLPNGKRGCLSGQGNRGRES